MASMSRHVLINICIVATIVVYRFFSDKIVVHTSGFQPFLYHDPLSNPL